MTFKCDKAFCALKPSRLLDAPGVTSTQQPKITAIANTTDVIVNERYLDLNI